MHRIPTYILMIISLFSLSSIPHTGKSNVLKSTLTCTLQSGICESQHPNNKEFFHIDTIAPNDTSTTKGNTLTELSEKAIDDVALLGRIWGFLKYHHPVIAKGQYDWDEELLEILPRYINMNSKIKRDVILLDWIQRLGNVPHCDSCQAMDSMAFLKPDLDWISNDRMNSSLADTLMYIYKNRTQGDHYYVQFKPDVGKPVFQNETRYQNNTFPDWKVRILGLFRYWNMIQYYYPYKHLIDKDWHQLLEEYIPRILEVQNELEYELVVLQLIGEVHDSHANLWKGGDQIEKWKGVYFPAVHVRFIENKLVVTNYYNPELKEQTGLNIGDVITKIDNREVYKIVRENAIYYPASNTASRLRGMAEDILRSNSDTIRVQFLRDSLELRASIPLYPKDSVNDYRWYKKDERESYKLLEDNIAYISLQTIQDEDIPVIKEKFRDTKGIIIDIRNYPSSFVPFTLGSYFVTSSTPFVKFTKVNPDLPGEFNFTKPLTIPPSPNPYTGPVIILVNEFTQSQAEYTTMAFQAGIQSIVVGSTTAGADGDVSMIHLPGGLLTAISGIGVYYPNGTETQRVGIVPDVEVNPTIQGIRAGRDEQLEKAIELIQTN